MILPTGGPSDRTEYEVQKTSSLGAPNWMKSCIQMSPEAARSIRNDLEQLHNRRDAYPPEFRIIVRTIHEEILPND